jgi:hypothetical protein
MASIQSLLYVFHNKTGKQIGIYDNFVYLHEHLLLGNELVCAQPNHLLLYEREVTLVVLTPGV